MQIFFFNKNEAGGKKYGLRSQDVLKVLSWKFSSGNTVIVKLNLISVMCFFLIVKHLLNFALENKRGQISSEAVWGIFLEDNIITFLQ